MQLPIVAPAPIVTAHADIFRDLFENRCQLHHCQYYFTGLILLDNKSLANSTRCVLESADQTNLSRFFSAAPWFQDRVNDRRVAYLLQQTKAVRSAKADGLLILDDTLCEHVGSLFDYVDRHDNHGDATYPLAHHPVTSHDVSGPVRFPVDLRLSRRYEELTQWEAFVPTHFPARPIPTTKKERARLHKDMDPIWLEAPDFQPLHAQFRTKIDLGIELVEAAIQHQLPLSVLLFDSWYLAEELVSMARYRKKDWSSLLKKNRNLETTSFTLKDATGQPLVLEGPPSAVADLVPRIPSTASRAGTVRDKTSWTCTLAVRLPGLGKVRLVVSFKSAELTGTSAVLVSNRVDWDARRIITLYLQRWPLETFYQDGKTPLGLDTDRMRNAEAIGKHWCLVFVAYAFLPLDCLPPSPTKGSFPPQNHWGSVSSASPSPHAGIAVVCARTTPTRAESGRSLCLFVFQATDSHGEMLVHLVLAKIQHPSLLSHWVAQPFLYHKVPQDPFRCSTRRGTEQEPLLRVAAGEQMGKLTRSE